MSLSIVFYHRGTPCFGDSPLQTPLGGTESAMIAMAEALAAMGHDVRIFCNVTRIGEYKGVQYCDAATFESYGLSHTPDVFICIRHLLPLMIRRWGKLQIYFSPDATDQMFLNCVIDVKLTLKEGQATVGAYSLADAHPYVDAIFCVGEWQKQTFVQKYNIPPQKIYVVHNGVDPSFFSIPKGDSLQKRGHHLVYCSTPYRGLDFLADYFPAIKEKVPDVTCTVLSGMQIYGFSNEADSSEFKNLYDKCTRAGMNMVGPVSKPRLAEYLLKSRVLVYPNTYTETFCMAVLEAQAMGLPVVTTQLAGLKERVSSNNDGFLIEGHPSSETYRSSFIQKTVDLLTQDDLWERMSCEALLKAQSFHYDKLAVEWDRLFKELMPQTIISNPAFPLSAKRYEILVGGYPKTVDLKVGFMAQSVAHKMKFYGFPYSASQFLKMSVNSLNSLIYHKEIQL
ncbi:glycosyltransferase family 4 protein [bacterium]|nr:glycosyltransferase family 4 protein [bacterium]